MNNKFYCGAARGDITPSPEELKGLRGLQDREFGGILDPIFVRAIALQNGPDKALILTFELDKTPYPGHYLSVLSGRTGVPEENIFLFSVHTHTAPILGDRTDDGPNNIAEKPQFVKDTTHSYERRIEQIVLDTAAEAVSALRPAKAGIGYGYSYINSARNQCYEYVENGERRRDYRLGISDELTQEDRKCAVARFDDESGKPIAMIVNYPVHCCVMHANTCCGGKLGLGGDIAGKVSAALENYFGDGCIAAWTSGAAGDINPYVTVEMYYADMKTGKQVTQAIPGDSTALLNIISSRHYQDVRRIAESVRCDRDDLPFACTSLISRSPGKAGDYEVRLHMLRTQDTAVVSASGELYSCYAMLARKVLPVKNVIVVNHDASLWTNSGYILDEAMFDLPGVDVPGFSHTNMKRGFRNSYVRCLKEMFEQTGTSQEESGRSG